MTYPYINFELNMCNFCKDFERNGGKQNVVNNFFSNCVVLPNVKLFLELEVRCLALLSLHYIFRTLYQSSTISKQMLRASFHNKI